MKKILISMAFLIAALILWTIAAAGPSRFIVKKQDATDEDAGAGILKVAQNLRFPSSLPSSPPPLYPATTAPPPAFTPAGESAHTSPATGNSSEKRTGIGDYESADG